MRDLNKLQLVQPLPPSLLPPPPSVPSVDVGPCLTQSLSLGRFRADRLAVTGKRKLAAVVSVCVGGVYVGV